MTKNMLKLSLKHPMYGYRRITILLREDSWFVNFKRVYRLWCHEGLKVPRKQHRRLYTGTSANSCDKKRSEYYNHVWSYDFLTERLDNCKRVPHASLKPGDTCPNGKKGTVYESVKPGHMARVVG